MGDVVCRACAGHGSVEVLGMRGGVCTSGVLTCQSCAGSGVEIPGGEERRAAGKAMRADRRARGLTMGAEAERLGITVVELSRRERGLP